MNNYHNNTYLKPDNGDKTKNAISHLLTGSNNLAILPEINLKLIQACNKGQKNIHEIAELIKMDPALCLKVIDMYYSGCHGGPKKLDNLESALNIIGLDTINIMVSYSSANSVFDGAVNGCNFDLKLFWRHSLKCAFLAELISKEVPNQSPDEAFLAGIFHDVGKLILLASLPNIYSSLFSDKSDQGNIILREKKTIGMDHCYVAYKLIDRWHYHPFMANAVLYHHYPVEKVAAALPLVKILYLANMLAGQDIPEQRDIFSEAKSLFGFTRDKLEEYSLYAEIKVNEAAAVFEIEDQTNGHNLAVNNDRVDARVNLANEIRETSLIAYAMQNLLRAKDKASVLKVLRQGFQMLFGNFNIIFFLYDKNENALIGHCSKDDEYFSLINGLRLSVQSDKSMLISCLDAMTPLVSFSSQKKSELTITDAQLIHFAGKEGILCLPILENGGLVGTIALGVERAEYSFLSRRINLLNRFVRQCALALSDVARKESEIKQSKSIQPGQAEILSRKLIHEINNPLSVIKNYLKVLGVKLEDHDIDHDEIRIINDEINRIVKMLRNLSPSSDKEAVTVKEHVNVNALLSDIMKLTKGSLGNEAGINIHLDSDPSIPEIMTEKDNLKQVFMNLIKNAMESMPEGGNIGIKTSRIKVLNINNEELKVADSTRDRIQISVTDDGPGISDEIRSRLFNECVTSKEGHEGLGLSIVRNLINKLNGSIKFESVMKKGTSFIIDLPLSPLE